MTGSDQKLPGRHWNTKIDLPLTAYWSSNNMQYSVSVGLATWWCGSKRISLIFGFVSVLSVKKFSLCFSIARHRFAFGLRHSKASRTPMVSYWVLIQVYHANAWFPSAHQLGHVVWKESHRSLVWFALCWLFYIIRHPFNCEGAQNSRTPVDSVIDLSDIDQGFPCSVWYLFTSLLIWLLISDLICSLSYAEFVF